MLSKPVYFLADTLFRCVALVLFYNPFVLCRQIVGFSGSSRRRKNRRRIQYNCLDRLGFRLWLRKERRTWVSKMAYDCYFASVMQAEFLEQGTSFHLVSHRESIYGCRRPTSSLVITPRLTFIASGCGVRGEGLGFRNFSSRFNLQNQINLLVPCRTGAIWSLEKRGIRFG